MITIDQAKSLKVGDLVYHSIKRNADGSKQRWKVNGKPKTWVRSRDRVKVPVKHGLYDHDYIDELSVHLVDIEE